MARALTPEAVMAEAERIMSAPFVWGPCDCCSAACDVFAAIWGIDPMMHVRGYVGLIGAVRLMRDHGGLPAMAERLAVATGLSAGHAMGGLALSTDRRSLLICIEPGLWAGKSLRGIAFVRRAERGWHA